MKPIPQENIDTLIQILSRVHGSDIEITTTPAGILVKLGRHKGAPEVRITTKNIDASNPWHWARECHYHLNTKIGRRY